MLNDAEIGKADGRKPDGLIARPHSEGKPSTREHGPVNWYAAPLSLGGVPFRFPWSQDFIRKVIRASTSAGPPIDPLYTFKCITFPNRYWKEPVGWPRARPVGRSPEILNHQLQHLDFAHVPGWIEAAAQIRQRNLQCRITSFARKSTWQPQGKMTMSGDMSLVMHDVINSVLGPQVPAEWDEHCLELEITSFPQWKRACELWNQPDWVSKRVSLAVDSREIARQHAFAPAMTTHTMAMSLDQPITIDLPTHVLGSEPDSPQMSQKPTGEHAAELTPDKGLVQPIADLSLPEDVSDSETVITVVSPQRRVSESTQNEKLPKKGPYASLHNETVNSGR